MGADQLSLLDSTSAKACSAHVGDSRAASQQPDERCAPCAMQGNTALCTVKSLNKYGLPVGHCMWPGGSMATLNYIGYSYTNTTTNEMPNASHATP